jgi:hypothetical protein
LIDFVSTGYSNLTITSAQRSNSNGPRDFNVQYSITGAGGPWTTITTSTAGNGAWSTLATFPLPASCDNQAQVFIRWLVSSNTQADGGSGISGAVNSRIDDIKITSTVATSADCAGGTTICSNSTFVGSSSGGGNYTDFNASNSDCLDPPEHQTSWYYFSSTTNGTIGFTITPALTTDDYDWAIWGPMATVTCPPATSPLRCSAADGNGTPANITGLGNGAIDYSEGPSGDGWVAALNILSGEVYVIVIDNWTGTSSPFTFSWQLSGGASLNCTPLPIELLSFAGKNEGIKNKLEWSTASEKNNDFFTLEHCKDGVLFESFATIAGAGNSTTLINYSSYDHQPFIGRTYYRLKQTDYNGKSSYSSIFSIENKSDEIAVSNVHPNPTKSDLNFDFSTSVEGTLSLQITDYIGRIVLERTQKIGEGKTSLIAQMNDLAKGVYTLKVEFSEGNYRSITKVIKN